MAENDAQDQHQLTQAQLEAIENEIKSTQPLTSPLMPIGVLMQQYTNTTSNDENDNGRGGCGQQEQGFVQSATFLSNKYNSLRKIRGDGNCYYRAFLYSLCEHLLRSLILCDGSDNDNDNKQHEEFSRLKNVVAQSLKWVCQYGYDEYTIDMFHEELVELFDFIEELSKRKSGKDGSDSDGKDLLENALKQLHSRLNEENASSDYCTWFMRVMTAAQMKSNPDQYLPFLLSENCMDVPSFCAREVEPMGKECGMVQVSALAECMGVRVVIEYMDGRMKVGEKLVHHVFGEGESGGNDRAAGGGERTSITLLYRPGHYDILFDA
eukprot:CAMPEP_0201876448 /NCGR_PEP_ID=MMETSP0902-20130614/8134_1 /ASSEMBLY_ACC=CAM_ASM_000551 /TAXON_ID=420261 /ORGANISM="Thalassiosira antarctica, Strain CCMP982" /LENGTH=322 /DNA_ID=CAMNT_0048403699 /DNA_START=30 /DNA_END=996 /DNA_ORIENTATION=-